MKFIFTSPEFPFSQGVVHSGKVLETVLTGIARGERFPVPGGVIAEMEEIFRQLDVILLEAGVTKASIVSSCLYLKDVNRDIADVNHAYRAYFGTHSPNRRAYGVDLQLGMLVEAAFVAEIGQEATV